MKTFKHSWKSINRKSAIISTAVLVAAIELLSEIATMMHELDVSSKDANKNEYSNPDELEVLFKEMIQMCLWHVLV